MVNINIEVPDATYKKVKLEAITKDRTVKDLIIAKLEEGLRRKKQ
jgi:hypothetical protein